MDFSQYLKGKTAETILYMVKGKVNMFKEGKKVDKMLDEQLGERSSEKIQRGTITSMLMRFLDGLFAESPEALAVTYELQAKDIRRNLNKGGKK